MAVCHVRGRAFGVLVARESADLLERNASESFVVLDFG
jgi:hypothetical protein